MNQDAGSMIDRRFAALEGKVRELESDRASDRARIAELEAGRSPTPIPAPVPASPPEPKRVEFEVGINHRRELVPGMSLRITKTDVARQSFAGLLTMRNGRVMEVREQRIYSPFPPSGKDRVVATRITRYSVVGYVSTATQ